MASGRATRHRGTTVPKPRNNSSMISYNAHDYVGSVCVCWSVFLCVSVCVCVCVYNLTTMWFVTRRVNVPATIPQMNRRDSNFPDFF